MKEGKKNFEQSPLLPEKTKSGESVPEVMSAPSPRGFQALVDAAFLARVDALREAYAVELTAKEDAEAMAEAKMVEDDSDSDDQRTAYSPKTCVSCTTTKTPLWRKGWWDEECGMHVLLCNACGMKYSKGQFCQICHTLVYGRQVAESTPLARCEECLQYSHAECEAQESGVEPAPISSTRGRTATSPGYKCVYCRQ